MALEDQIKDAQDALINADKAGDVEAAKILADHIVSLQSQLGQQETKPETEDKVIPVASSTAVGGATGLALGRGLQSGIREEFPNLYRNTPAPTTAPSNIPNVTVVGAPEAPKTGGEKWVKTLTGADIPGAEMDKKNLKLAQGMRETVGRGGELAGGKITESGIMLGPEAAAEQAAAEAATAAKAAKGPSLATRAIEAVKSASPKALNRGVGHVMHGMTSPWLVNMAANTLGGAVTAAQAADAYQRLKDPNQGWVRGAISGLGALGSGAAMTRIPAAMPIGMAVGTAAPFINEYLDKWAAENPEAAKKWHLAEGGEVKPIMHMAAGGDLLMKSIKAAREITGYVPHTPQKPSELVGKRFEREMVGELAPKTEFDPSKHKGAAIKIFPYDSTSRGYNVSSVSGHQLINPLTTTGGQDYLRDVAHINAGIGGASNLDIAKRVLDRQKAAARAGEKAGGTGEVIMMPTTMGAGAENFSSMPTSIMLDLLRQRELPKKSVRSLDEQVRALRDPKKGAIFENFVGFNSPDLKEQMTTGGFGLNTTPGELRKAIANRLGMVENQKLLDYNLGDLTESITDPSLSGLPKGFAGNVVARGNPEGVLTPSLHPDYSHNYPGSYVGSGASMPVEFWLPEAYKNIGNELRAKYPNINESNLHNSIIGALEKRKEGFSGLVNDQVIENYGRFKEGLEGGKFEPNDLWAIRQHMYPDNFAEGGVVNMAEGGLSALAKKVLKKYGVGLGLTTPFAAEAAHDVAQGNPGSALDVASGFLPPPAMAAYMGLAPSETAPMHMDQYPGRQGTNPLAGTGSVMENYVPHMAGGGDLIKALAKKAMGAAEGVGARTIEGSPHTYPPIAEGPWMREYQQSGVGTGLPTTPEEWAALAEARQAAQNKVDYLMGDTGPNKPDLVQYWGKYRRGTPEERAAQRQSDIDTIKMLQKLRGLD